MMLLAFFVGGVFVGVFITCLTLGMCALAKRSDEVMRP
jgi:hypothetical protein